MNDTAMPFVSVIIPVYNDSERLKTCLRALEMQTYPPEQYEVIVVDNQSDEGLDLIVAAFPHAISIVETQRSSYAARNAGILRTQGQIVAFTDSDCIPAEDWLEAGVKHLMSTSNCGLIGGKIELFFQTSGRPTAVELYDSLMHLQQHLFVNAMRFSATANLFTFKTVFDRVGLFDSRLKSGGDKEWGQRVFSAGYRLVYADDVCITHPARATFRQLRGKERRLAGGSWGAIDWKRHLPPMTWTYESILYRLPPLPPVFKILRYRNTTFCTKLTTIMLWFVMQLIIVYEKWRFRRGSNQEERA